MKIYTGRGDDGTAGLLSGERVPKSHERIDAFGTVDELSSALGVLRAGLTGDDPETGNQLRRIQSDLMKVGAWLAAWRDAPVLEKLAGITDEDIRFLEASIDSLEEFLPALKGFLLTGGHPSAAWPITRLAAAAIWSVKPTSVIFNGSPNKSGVPRKFCTGASPLRPMVTPTTPKRQGRPWLSMINTGGRTPLKPANRWRMARAEASGFSGRRNKTPVSSLTLE